MNMNNKWAYGFMILTLSILVSGCAGHDRVLFATKTNVGLDVDSTPPTAEITISRREIAIQPTYHDTEDKPSELALPLIAAFGFQGKFYSPKISAQFAGGDAAVYITKMDESKNSGKDKINSAVCLDDIPEKPFVLLDWIFGTSDAEPKPFYFATDTSFGLKVAWSGTAGAVPDTMKLGYNRKEFAYAPTFVETGCSNGEDTDWDNKRQRWQVRVPSFYASIDNGYTLEDGANSSIKHVQFFATGVAATQFAKRPSVRKIAFQNMAPDAAILEEENPILNKELISDIEIAYDQISNAQLDDAAKKQRKKKIIDEAIKLGLINENIPEDNKDSFFKPLRESGKSAQPKTSNKLINLRRVAIATAA